MRRPVLKNSNKKLKGNISLLVILILLASSVIGLLSINQIQRLINYFRAFYLAKAWTELWLTEVYNRENWFEDEIENTKSEDDGQIKFHDIIKNNFLWEETEEWEKRKYEAFNPYFDMKIKSNFEYITNDVRNSTSCSEDNKKINLAPWEWIMLSLFKDDTKGLSDILSDNTNNNNLETLKGFENLSLYPNPSNDLTFGFFTYDKDGNMNNVEVSKDVDLKRFLKDKSINNNEKGYLTIKNSWESKVEFCITAKNDKIPYSDFLIDVIWHYGDMEVWIQSVVKKWVPDWALNVLGYE